MNPCQLVEQVWAGNVPGGHAVSSTSSVAGMGHQVAPAGLCLVEGSASYTLLLQAKAYSVLGLNYRSLSVLKLNTAGTYTQLGVSDASTTG